MPIQSRSTTPIDHIRLGAIQAAIWSNDTENGPRFSVTVERMYRQSESGEWKYTGNFSRDDLLTLAKVADMAHTRIHEIQGQMRAKARAAEGHAASDEQTSASSSPGGASEASGANARGKATARSR